MPRVESARQIPLQWPTGFTPLSHSTPNPPEHIQRYALSPLLCCALCHERKRGQACFLAAPLPFKIFTPAEKSLVHTAVNEMRREKKGLFNKEQASTHAVPNRGDSPWCWACVSRRQQQQVGCGREGTSTKEGRRWQ